MRSGCDPVSAELSSPDTEGVTPVGVMMPLKAMPPALQASQRLKKLSPHYIPAFQGISAAPNTRAPCLQMSAPYSIIGRRPLHMALTSSSHDEIMHKTVLLQR